MVKVKWKRRSVLPGFGLTMGYTVFYLSLIVLIPLSGLFFKSSSGGWESFWRAATDERREIGYDAGLGIGLSPLPGLEADLRAEFVLIALDETSRKFVNVTLGASYHFLNLP